MNVSELLKNTDKTLFSFEVLPPLKGRGIDAIYQTIDSLLEFNPAYINITSHAADEQYRQNADGTFDKVMVHKRPSTVASAAAIKYKYNIEVVPHIICSGLNAEEIENILIDLDFLDLHNLFVLRGDPQKGLRRFAPKAGGHEHTTALMEQINKMNSGIYSDDSIKNSVATHFTMGVAGYPEKHLEAPNMETDLFYLKEKVRLGAKYVVTQLFFDNQKYFDFVRMCRAEGIDVPIVPGLKPISGLNDIKLLPQTFNIDIPEDLVKALANCKSNEEARAVGVEWAIAQSKELMKFGVPALHFYTLGQAASVRKICKEVF